MQSSNSESKTNPQSPTTASNSVFQLLQGVLMFVFVEVFFTGFGAAFAYSSHQLAGVLTFLLVSQVMSPITYIANLHAIKRGGNSAARHMNLGTATMFLSIMLGGMMEGHAGASIVMAAIGGAGRGVAFCSRTWLEIKLTRHAVRERYLSRLESLGTILKVAIPLVASGVLAVSSDRFIWLFLGVGLLGTIFTLIFVPVDIESDAPDRIGLKESIRQRGVWATAPFFLADGAGYAVRTAMFVSGAMAVVGSAAGYASIEAGASLLAASILWWISTKHKTEPSLSRLRDSLTLMAFAWGGLVAALHEPWALAVFVAGYAAANPLVTMCKRGLTLKEFSNPHTSVSAGMAARMLLITGGRFIGLGVALAINAMVQEQSMRLICLVLFALLLIPAEYYSAASISRRRDGDAASGLAGQKSSA
jgi:hypothetical protein